MDLRSNSRSVKALFTYLYYTFYFTLYNYSSVFNNSFCKFYSTIILWVNRVNDAVLGREIPASLRMRALVTTDQ